MNAEPTTKPISFRLRPDLLAAVDERADRAGVARSQIVSVLLKHAMDQTLDEVETIYLKRALTEKENADEQPNLFA